MLYELEQGKTEAFIVEQALKNGSPIPDRILNKPVLRPGLDFYFTAFIELSTERQIGQAEGPIPLSAIREWAKDCGIYSPSEYERLKQLVWSLDTVYLNHRATKIKEEAGKGAGSGKKTFKRSS